MPDPVGRSAEFETSVFVNCPFDDAYKPMFEAIVFAVFDCGYGPRCALEAACCMEVAGGLGWRVGIGRLPFC